MGNTDAFPQELGYLGGFGVTMDGTTATRHAQRLREAEAAQKVEYAVLPNHTVRCVDRIAREGEEITLADLGGRHDLLAEAVQSGAVHRLMPAELAARTGNPTGYRLTSSVTCRHGILTAGTPVQASDFDYSKHSRDYSGRRDGGKAAFEALIARGIVVADEVA